jgi:hypothetical protein
MNVVIKAAFSPLRRLEAMLRENKKLSKDLLTGL